ncbi:hypothetical protein SSX86_028703 [Deinandra increscens subsp. villosa]|uniref:GDSL esterase/lipase 5-like n=1 Tax=Deinandra increscens subsp. villosa TaxID=3103831 RepID=A0AAP0C965_9ASTR
MAPLLLLLLLLCNCASLSAVEVESRNNNSSSRSMLFLFGDSFFDVGNNNYINTTTLDQSNFPPYGRTHFHFPTGRFSDGRIIPDFIMEFAKVPLIPPYLNPSSYRYYYDIGANFASAGAGALLQTFQGSVISLGSQLRYHKRVVKRLKKRYGNREASNRLSKAVYLFSIGTNDYISPYLIISNSTTHHSNFNSHRHQQQLVQVVIGNLTASIKELHQRGARKFGFLNLGPLGCFPGLRVIQPPNATTTGCLQSASLLATLHNLALTNTLNRLARQLHGFKYSLYDFNHSLQRRLKHPSRYGFKQGKTACCGTGRFRGTFSCGGKRPVKEYQVCGNPQEYVFWDSYHLTERVYREMAQQMWNQQPTTPGTSNLKTLFHSI